ncbi:hypothetical protein KKH23_09900 [Patescibacteria group bacterium]|uniref:Uncharacterized protein n=2 Tax=viral metagenome TaxID=1070528 RepID=A0A6M3LXU6_9ZZZZ|nr:hypothetical protein [Patescibacteria group bacterium]MBU0847484.1 hypothetical protein [Patescibacteria group bacterium]
MKKDNEERGDTSITISKEDLPLFNEYRAREAGRKGESNISHPDFLRFLLSLYRGADNADRGVAWKRVEGRTGRKKGRDRS